MKPRNHASIRRKTFRFWTLFVLLIVFTALPALCLIWTARAQYERQHVAWEEYQDQIQRGKVLYNKTNSLFDAVNTINSDEPMSYRRQCGEAFALTTGMEKIAGLDSSGLFLGYMRIAKNINSLLLVKYTNAVKQAQIGRHTAETLENERIRRDIYNHHQ